MCPSYMVTLEEEHSTRGRAHMLFEVLQGEVVRDGWKDEHVKKALDLCLSCKACKSECPTNVDVATYKAEFLAHYYEEKSRPLHAYAFGMIDRWAQLGSKAPWLANFFSTAPGFRQILQSILHLAPQRTMPQLAGTTFQSWARKKHVPSLGGIRGFRSGIRKERRHFVGRHLQQLFSSGDEPGGAGSACRARVST